MDDAVRLLALTIGDPFDRRTFSGSNSGILSALRDRNALAAAFDAEIHGVGKYLTAAIEYSPDRKLWKQRFKYGKWHHSLMCRKASRLIDACEVDYNAVFQVGARFTPSGRKKDVPVVSYHDNTIALSQKGGIHSFTNLLGSRYLDRAFQNEKAVYCDNALVFTFSDQVKRSVIRDFKVSEKKVHTVYCGINVAIAGLPDDLMARKIENRTILFVGVDFERKGGRTVLEAFRLVKRDVPRAKLVIVGSSPKVALDGVQVVGYLDPKSERGKAELASHFTNASVFVMPSHFEPFGIPFVEAMNYRTPCIGTTIGAIPEMIKEGENGFLIEPGDHVALAGHLTEILTNPGLLQSLGENGFLRVRRTFTWDAVAAKMLAHIKETL